MIKQLDTIGVLRCKPGAVVAILMLCYLVVRPPAGAFALPVAEPGETAAAIARRIEAAVSQERFTCQGELICGLALIPDFYAARGYRPAWSGGQSRPAAATDLLAAIQSVYRFGLVPADYNFPRLQQMTRALDLAYARQGFADARLRADYDLLMTDAFFLLASHILGGRVNPEKIHPEWEAFDHEADLASLLETALKTSRVRGVVERLHPRAGGFQGMRQALARYRRIEAQGGWGSIPEGERLERGMESAAVARLRRRLISSGDLTAIQHFNPFLFDRSLERAVVAFQARHGIAPDGIVGDHTRRVLNVPVGDRIRQLEINMERWRWVPRDLGPRYLLVNIADYSLTAFVDRRPGLRMRVIVGRAYRQTPVFSENMTYLVLNPFWEIPSKLALEDVLPKIRSNPDYMRRQGLRLLSGWDAGAREMDPTAIDWAQVAAGRFGLRLRQDPGPRNALGRIKFMLPNKYAVYLHDTPTRRQFGALARNFSSGCIRVEDPIGLAEFVLDDDRRWSPEIIRAAIAEGKTQVVTLEQALPVHILYWTAWSDADGTIHFRDDIYKRDAPLIRALQTRRPPGQPA